MKDKFMEIDFLLEKTPYRNCVKMIGEQYGAI